MTRLSLFIAVPVLAFAPGVSLAQSCTPPTEANFGIAMVPDGSGASVLFSDFEASAGGVGPSSASISCAFTVPFNNSGYRVFQGDFTGFVALDTDQSAELSETEPGEATIYAEDGPLVDVITLDDVVAYGVGPYSELDLAYLLTLEAGAGPDALASIDTLDLSQVAWVAEDDLQNSLDDLARQRRAVLTHLGGSAGIMLGSLEPLEGEDEFAPFAAAGSYLAGVKGRLNLDDGYSVLGGAAVFSQDAGAPAEGMIAGGAVRYIEPSDGAVRFFGQAGIWGSPSISVQLVRSYTDLGENEVALPELITADSTLTGAFASLHGRAGVLIDFDDVHQLALGATLEQGLFAYSFAEDGGPDNWFAASADGAVSGMTTAKLDASWTLRPTEGFELTAMVAVGYSAGDMAVDVDFAGEQTGHSAGLFAEAGLRAGLNLTDAISLDAFAGVTTGPEIGTHSQFGGALRIRF